jgi:uncharacterized membrane protein YozB (DUF420 family)
MKIFNIDNNNILLSFTEGMFTFLFIVLTWVVFRSESVRDSMEYIKGMFSSSLFSNPGDLPVIEITIALLFIISEFIQKGKNHALQFEKLNSVWVRWSIYASLVFIILLFGGGAQEFIYFQF